MGLYFVRHARKLIIEVAMLVKSMLYAYAMFIKRVPAPG